jgi:hypothetical protein
MANKIVGFTINIDGIDSINDLNKAIKQTEVELQMELQIETIKINKIQLQMEQFI